MKYGMWLDEWFRNYIQPSSKIKTCERYFEIIEKHLKVKLGEYELDELTPLVLQRYVTELLRSGNIVTGKGLAANSVNGIITVIQNSLKLAYTLGELKEYTADKIKRPKTKEKEVSCFSLAEQKKIEQAALSSKKRKPRAQKNPKARRNRSFPRKSLRHSRRLLPMKSTVLFLSRMRILSAGSRLTARRLIIPSCSLRTAPTII